MGALLGSAAKANSVKPQYTGLQVQTASSVVPLPIVYGRNAIAPNLIYYSNFQTHAVKTKTGGKGASSGTTTDYTYTADVIMGLCEGPIVKTDRVWIDKAEMSTTEEGWTTFLGTIPQAAWPYLVGADPTSAIPYNGTAYLAQSNFSLGSGATVGNHNVEVYGILNGSLADIGNPSDADPALMIFDFLTNPQYGAYFAEGFIDQSSLLGPDGGNSYQAFCRACGYWLSPAIVNQEKASDILARWLQLTNSDVLFSDGVLKFRPLAENDVTGASPTHWLSQVGAIYDLTEEDFVDTGDDPIQITRIDVSQQPNVTRLEISDVTNAFVKTLVEARDESAIRLYGCRVGDTVTANEIISTQLARVVGQIILQRGLYIRNNYKFTLSWEYCLLEPLDVVTITDAGLGLNQRAVRIVSLEEDDSGALTVTAEDLVGGVSAPPLVSTVPTQPVVTTPVNTAALPPDYNHPFVLFEPSAALTGGVAELWIGASPLNNADHWGGGIVLMSVDFGVSYTTVGTFNGRLAQGVTTSGPIQPPAFGPVTSVTVDLTVSGGSLESFSAAQAAAGQGLFLIGLDSAYVAGDSVEAELFSYEQATLVGSNQYTLTGLQRTLDGTQGLYHVNGDQFSQVDPSVMCRVPLPDALIGETVYFKIIPLNEFGRADPHNTGGAMMPLTILGVARGGTRNAFLNQLALGKSVDLGLAVPDNPSATDGTAYHSHTLVADLGYYLGPGAAGSTFTDLGTIR